MRPFEVVEEAPHEVAVHRHAVLGGAADCVEVRPDVLLPLGIVHAAVVHAHVAERGAVLRDVHRRWRVLGGDPQEQLVEPLRIDLPAHVGHLRFGIAHEARAFAVRARADDVPEVVVHAEEVDRHGDRLHVAVADGDRCRPVRLEHVGRVFAAEDGIEEPAVPVAVDLARSCLVLRRVGGGVDVSEVERDPHLSVRRIAAQHVHGPPVREKEMVRGRDRVRSARTPGRVLAPGVAEPGHDPRLVVRDPVADAVTETPADGIGVLDEPLCRRALRPASRVLERLRRIPVEEGRVGLDPLGEQLVDEPVVEVEPGLVDWPASGGNDARPRDREAEGVESELAHERDVLGIAVVEVARDCGGVAVAHLPRGHGEPVPHALAAPVLAGRAFDLVRRRRGAPDEIGGEDGGRLGAHLIPLGQTRTGTVVSATAGPGAVT